MSCSDSSTNFLSRSTVSSSSTSRSMDATSFMVGGISGAISKTATAPLSRITILLQIRSGSEARCQNTPLSPIGTLRRVMVDEGILALWRGNAASICQKSLSSGLNFICFDSGTRALKPYWASEDRPGFKVNLMVGIATGGLTSTVLYPLDLARTLQASQREGPIGYAEMMKKVYVRGGLGTRNGLYQGLFASIPCHTLNIGLSFAIFYTLKAREEFKWSGTFGGVASSLVVGGITALCASTLTHPLDLIRRRQQVDVGEWSAQTIARDIWNKERMRGFYRGLAPELVKAIPGCTVNFMLYDSIIRLVREV